MSAIPRGLALIIENVDYENDIESHRQGSQIDVSNLTSLFHHQLHFKTIHKKNLTRRQFFEELKSFAENPDHVRSDMMILVVLSHGRENQLISVDGLGVDLELMFEHFNNVNCPVLIGKPKFFIIQACRGVRTDQSLVRSRSNSISTGDAAGYKNPLGDDEDLNFSRPNWEDMVIAYR